jgi:hypothetical protein
MSERTSVRAAIATDFRTSRAGHRIALAVVVVWLAYEWGIGNETVTPWLLARVIADTDGAAAIPVAAAVGFGFTTVQQLLAGLTALAGFSLFERTAQAAWERLTERFGRAPGEWSTLGPAARTALVFGLGTTAVALVQITTTGQVGVRRHRAVVVQAALLCGTVVGALGAAAGALATLGRGVPALEGVTNQVLRVLGNPLLWLGVLVVGALVHTARRRRASVSGAAASGGSPASS